MTDSALAADNHFPTIIIGTGLAGYTLARELRKLSPESRLLMLTRDDGAWYSKPMLSNGFAKNKSAEALATKSADEMAASLNATIHAFTSVESINTALNSISTGQGQFTYDSLVLACGAQQINLPIEGQGVDDVLTVNDLMDYARFRTRMETVDRVAIMGPGLIGCEFANDLSSVGKTSIIIGPDTRPLERLIPEAASQALKTAMDELPVEWKLETVVERIEKTGSSEHNSSDNKSPDNHTAEYQLTLSNGETIDAGLVLSAAGLKPDCRLAIQAGIECNLGIVCDRFFRTSDPSVYALGDCIEIEGMVMPYVMPIMLGSKALAKTLSGEPTAVIFPTMPVAIKTPVHPIVVATPAPGIVGEWQSEDDGGGVRSLFHDRDGNLVGFVLTGDKIREKVKLERQLPKLIS